VGHADRAAAELRDAELAKADAAYDKKIDRVADKLVREERELREDEAEHAQRKREEGLSHAETVMSLFSRRRRSLSLCQDNLLFFPAVFLLQDQSLSDEALHGSIHFQVNILFRRLYHLQPPLLLR